MTTDSLIHDLTQAGIVQFGLFTDSVPVRFNLSLLPAYPAILRKIGEVGVQHFQSHEIDRLVVPVDSLPAGLSIGLHANISLAYCEVTTESTQIVGAYDTGHATALVLNCWLGRDTEHEIITAMINHCQRVGLNVVHVLSVIGTSAPPQGFAGFYSYLVPADEMVDVLVQSGDIPEGHAVAVRNWLARSS